MDMACFSVYPANFHYLRTIDDINNLYQQKGKGWGKIFEKLNFAPGDPPTTEGGKHLKGKNSTTISL